MIALLLAAVAVGLSNLAAAIGIGVSGVDSTIRLRVALVFGLFEAGMPLAGIVIGHAVSEAVTGPAVRWLAGGLLAAVGCYQVIAWLRSGPEKPPSRGWSGWRLVASGLLLSVDNLAVGFALGSYDVPVVTAVVVIGLVSASMSLAGLELGAKLGLSLGQRAELAGGLVLVLIGALVAAGLF